MFTPQSATRAVTQDDAERAACTLGIVMDTVPLDSQLIQASFRSLLRRVHPDAGGDAAAAPDRIKELRAARDTLLAWLAAAPKKDCTMCRGTGYVFGKFAVTRCTRCGA